MTTTTTRKADLSKAGLLGRLSYRIHELEMDRLNGRITDREYQEDRANFDRMEVALLALPS
jgi:hypothetical protein